MTDHITEGVQQTIAKTATFGGSGTAVTGGIWAFIGNNAPQIGAICSIVGLVIAVLGYRWLAKHKKLEIEIAQARLEAMRKDN